MARGAWSHCGLAWSRAETTTRTLFAGGVGRGVAGGDDVLARRTDSARGAGGGVSHGAVIGSRHTGWADGVGGGIAYDALV